MRCYKIIQGNEVIGAGYLYLKYYARSGRYCYCELEKAQCVQDTLTERMFHADWLLDPPMGAPAFPEATVILISETEYDEIIAELDGGETIPVPVDPDTTPEPEPEPDPDIEPERPMTVQEMREKIAELTALVMTTSAPFKADADYSAGDIITNGSKVYIADSAIMKDETVIPGRNCMETTIADVLNGLHATPETDTPSF